MNIQLCSKVQLVCVVFSCNVTETYLKHQWLSIGQETCHSLACQPQLVLVLSNTKRDANYVQSVLSNVDLGVGWEGVRRLVQYEGGHECGNEERICRTGYLKVIDST